MIYINEKQSLQIHITINYYCILAHAFHSQTLERKEEKKNSKNIFLFVYIDMDIDFIYNIICLLNKDILLC